MLKDPFAVYGKIQVPQKDNSSPPKLLISDKWDESDARGIYLFPLPIY